MYWLEPPFNMIISAPTCSGKTEYLLQLLSTVYKNKFEYIIIVCPTYYNNSTYERKYIYTDEDVIIVIPDLDYIDETLQYIHETYKNTDSLIILDDCASSKDMKSRTDELTKLGFSARHDKLSIWVLTQQYSSIAKPFRENIGMLILFYTPSKNDMKTIIEDYGMELDKNEINEYINQLKSQPFSKLIFRLRHPYEIKFIM